MALSEFDGVLTIEVILANFPLLFSFFRKMSKSDERFTWSSRQLVWAILIDILMPEFTNAIARELNGRYLFALLRCEHVLPPIRGNGSRILLYLPL